MSYEIHPLAELIPPMTEAEYRDLKSDIAANGVKSPITIFEGQILDGRHRYRACSDLDLEPHFVDFEGDEPARFVISLNLKRRNLTKSQLAMTAADFLPALEEEARKRQGSHLRDAERDDLGHAKSAQNRADLDESGRGSRDGRAASEAAEITGASTRYVQAAKRVSEADPDLAEKVKAGEVSLDAAEKQVSGLPPRKGEASGLDTKTDITGRQQPSTFFGKGDKWQEATEPLVRYLRGQKNRDFDFSHLNWKEAKKRVQRIDDLITDLQAARADLEPRSHKAKLSF